MWKIRIILLLWNQNKQQTLGNSILEVIIRTAEADKLQNEGVKMVTEY